MKKRRRSPMVRVRFKLRFLPPGHDKALRKVARETGLQEWEVIRLALECMWRVRRREPTKFDALATRVGRYPDRWWSGRLIRHDPPPVRLTRSTDPEAVKSAEDGDLPPMPEYELGPLS